MNSLSFKKLKDGRSSILLEERQLFVFSAGSDGEHCIAGGEAAVTSIFEQVSEKHLCIHSEFSTEREVNWIYPIFDAKLLYSPLGVFRQGFGLGGPSGFMEPKDIQSENIIYSHGMLMLKYKEGYLAIYAENHARYDNRYDIRTDCREEGIFRISAGFGLENTVREGSLPCIHVFFGTDMAKVMEHIAKTIAAPLSPPVPEEPAYHWCSWYYYYNNLSLEQLKEFLEGLKLLEPQIPIKYVQIDAGYFTAAGDWLEANHLWPNGLKAAFDMIKAYGYRPGIWIAPFMAGSRSRLARENPEWLLKHRDGRLVSMLHCYNEPKVWGYQDEEYHVLDTSVPEAMDYLRRVFKTMKQWGAEFFKTDFMLWGIHPSHQVLRATQGKTSIEYYREVMRMIKDEIQDSYWLGCIAPFLPSLGFVNGMRIAGDVGAKWDGEGFGPEEMIRELVADNYFNGIYWQNDPDALILRDFHVFLKEYEIRSLALLQAMSGGTVYTSDPLHLIASDRRDLFSFVKPDRIRKPELPFIDRKQELLVLHHSLENRRHVLLLFNPTEKALSVFYAMSEITGLDEMYIQDWTHQRISESKEAYIGGVIGAHDCMLVFGNEEEPVAREINNLWKW